MEGSLLGKDDRDLLPSLVPARLAKRENVAFHRNSGGRRERWVPSVQALQAGQVLTVGNPTLQSWQRSAGESRTLNTIESSRAGTRGGHEPYHFHRLFKSITGLTPKEYHVAHRAGRLRSQLGQGRTVTEAIFAAGFNSGGRFYETSHEYWV